MTDERSEETQEEQPAPAEQDQVESQPVSADAAEPVAEEAQAAEPVAATPELTLGSGAPADVDEEQPHAKPVTRGKVDRFGVATGTGRRKTSVARVRIKDGTGAFMINGRPVEQYFSIERDRKMVEAPLRAAEAHGKVDVWVRVGGGGTTGQTGAIVLGVARALQVKEPALHRVLSDGGYLTRDDRMVERKKYGLRKARRSFQFSKR